MKLRYDPYQVFRSSQTPAGLYARQKWLDEVDTPTWQTDFDETVNALFAGQLPDGSWQQSVTVTISRLFGLHLTVRSSNSRIEDALNWLFNNMQRKLEGIHIRSRSDVACDELTGLPFVSSNPVMLMTGATLFLCSIFDRQHNPAVWAVYQRVNSDDRIKKCLRQDIAAMRTFAERLRNMERRVIYLKLDDPGNRQTLGANIRVLLDQHHIGSFEYLLPDEYRLDSQLKELAKTLPVPCHATG